MYAGKAHEAVAIVVGIDHKMSERFVKSAHPVCEDNPVVEQRVHVIDAERTEYALHGERLYAGIVEVDGERPHHFRKKDEAEEPKTQVHAHVDEPLPVVVIRALAEQPVDDIQIVEDSHHRPLLCIAVQDHDHRGNNHHGDLDEENYVVLRDRVLFAELVVQRVADDHQHEKQVEQNADFRKSRAVRAQLPLTRVPLDVVNQNELADQVEHPELLVDVHFSLQKPRTDPNIPHPDA